MKEFFRTIRTDRIFFRGFLGIFILIIVNLILNLIFYAKLPPLIPIFNQMPWGEERLGTKTEIFMPLVITILVVVINIIVLALYYKKMPLVARMLILTSFLTTLLALLFTMRTIQTVVL